MTEPVRQIGAPDGTLLLDLLVIQRAVGDLLEAALGETGVRPVEYAVHGQLAKGPLTPRELSALLGLPPSTLTGVLRALEERGDTERTADPRDRRSYRVALTRAGKRRHTEARRRFRVALDLLHEELPDDAGEARALLLRIDEALGRARDRLS
ncbi:MAG: MarR family transcriptional regulator [Nocardioidaceae bacterium]|nr:MarR family transcriptional regulator [Nocardioidaceae bacterium]